MTVIVAPLERVSELILARRPARLVSLLSPDGLEPPEWSHGPHLSLRFHDIGEPREGLTAPDVDMIDRLLAFGREWREPGPLLAHCWFGISRSPAAAYILACAADPSRSEDEIADALRHAAPEATPNPMMVRLADDRLGRGGRMAQAIARIGRGREASCGSPFELKARPDQE
jgi:predicted protein tyrosine phosphatase